ncbi:MAG: HAMP domain-containing histidine kinase, partial [Bacilli bacterium]|nr:HAMP domain-containing histidine kinase [Bacilli bacterium]
MNAGISFYICSFFYIVLLVIIYFSKERLESNENKIYSWLIIATVIGISLEITSTIFNLHISGFETFKMILLRLLNVYFLTWIFIFFIYTYYISKKSNKMNFSLPIIIYILLALITFCLPINLKISDGVLKYTYGPSVDFVYLISGVLILGCIISMFKNFKNIKTKKYIPLLVFIVIGVMIAGVQMIFPDLLLMSSMQTFVTFLMYFTIENPDLQMVRELYKNKKLIEKSNEDTSKFIFRMTQDIKKPVKDIISMSHDASSIDDMEELKSDIKYINNYANQIDYLMNKALNISNMDTQKIKVFDTRYNVENLFKEITFRAKEDIKENIKFDFNISSNIPTYLYGDTIKIKQAVSSIINIANDFTIEGFISLDVSSIIRYNMCRLIITIEDSGKGIGIDRINQILSFNSDDMKNIDTDNKDDRKLDILSVKKLINMLGGSLMIKS